MLNLYTENEESPPFVGYDPSHPTVFFTILKWYDDPEKAAEQLIELYPPHLSPTSPSLPLFLPPLLALRAVVSLS